MKKIALLCAVLLLLTSCSVPSAEETPAPTKSPSPSQRPIATPTAAVSSQTPAATVTPVVETPSSPHPMESSAPVVTPSPVVSNTPTISETPGLPWDGNLSTLTLEDFPTQLMEEASISAAVEQQAENSTALYLVAQLPDQDTWLYGVYGPARQQGLILRVGPQWQYFGLSFLTPRSILPVMSYGDFDSDMELELALILYTASGTGVAVEDLHIIELGSDGMWLDIAFQPQDYQAILEASVVYTYDEESGIVTIQAGESTMEWDTTTVTDMGTYVGPSSFENIVSFYCDGDTITASFDAAVLYSAAVSPIYIGTVTATVVYTNSAFGLTDLVLTAN